MSGRPRPLVINGVPESQTHTTSTGASQAPQSEVAVAQPTTTSPQESRQLYRLADGSVRSTPKAGGGGGQISPGSSETVLWSSKSAAGRPTPPSTNPTGNVRQPVSREERREALNDFRQSEARRETERLEEDRDSAYGAE